MARKSNLAKEGEIVIARKRAVNSALDALRKYVSDCPGTELEVLKAFSDEIGAEVEGWEYRIRELEEEEEEENEEW